MITETMPKTPTPKYPLGDAPAPSSGESGRIRWTVEAFYRLADSGVLGEPIRWELLNGEIVDRGNMNPPHAFTSGKISQLIRRIFAPDSLVLEEKPVHFSTDGEPVPDICVVVGRGDVYFQRHPTEKDVLLLIEVADTTETKDTGEKAALYALAGIADYWVVLVSKRQVNVYRQPQNGEYPKPLELKDGDTVSPLAAPGVTIAVSDLLPPATSGGTP